MLTRPELALYVVGVYNASLKHIYGIIYGKSSGRKTGSSVSRPIDRAIDRAVDSPLAMGLVCH